MKRSSGSKQEPGGNQVVDVMDKQQYARWRTDGNGLSDAQKQEVCRVVQQGTKHGLIP